MLREERGKQPQAQAAPADEGTESKMNKKLASIGRWK